MSDNKENLNDSSKRTKSYRESVGISKSIVVNYDSPKSSELTNEFAGYLDYVRTVEEENESLKSEKENLISVCKIEIVNIKSTYDDEIDALRKALDEAAKEKCSTEYHNKRLLEENNNLKIKFSRKIETINDLEKKYEKSESNLIKLRKAVEQYNNVCQENEDLSNQNLLINEQLKNEINKRAEVESHVLTLSDEMEFLKKLNSSSNIINRESYSNIKNDVYYKEKINSEMKSTREELTEEFNQYKEQMKETFNQKIDEITTMNIKLNEKLNNINAVKKSLQMENDNLQNNIVAFKNKIETMSARDIRHGEIVSKINKEHDAFIKDILEENTAIKVKLKEMNLEITNLLNEKIANDKETYIFRSMLKGEQSRFNLTDGSNPKKRKIAEDDELSAWSKGAAKLFCNSDYNGNYLQILSSKEINLNEWKIEIDTKSGTELLYTFPRRIVNADSSLKVWSFGQDVPEDNDNIVMNVCLPSSDIMTCKLKNDMDEVEASFDLKRTHIKRKILKAAMRKPLTDEKCLIM